MSIPCPYCGGRIPMTKDQKRISKRKRDARYRAAHRDSIMEKQRKRRA
jgi:DNA-directed RNA polymerase subunit RPC12/RpoP